MAAFSSTVLHQLPVKRLPNIWFSDLLTVNVDAIHLRAVSSVWLAMLGLLWVRITVWNLINNQINLYSKWTPQRSWLLSLSSKGVWFMSILKYFYVCVCVWCIPAVVMVCMLRYAQVIEHSHHCWTNTSALVSGCINALGLVMVGNFQVSRREWTCAFSPLYKSKLTSIPLSPSPIFFRSIMPRLFIMWEQA